MSLRDQIIAVDDLKTATVHVKEWNMDVMVRELNSGERDKIFSMHAAESGVAAVFRTLEIAVIDEDGSRALEDGDAEMLAQKSDAAITKLYSKIMELSGCRIKNPNEESESGKSLEKTQLSGENSDSCISLESEPTQS